MALNNKKINMAADSVVNDVKISSFVAAVNLDDFHVQIVERRLDEEAYEEFRNIVRADRAEFEDMVYDIKNDLKGMLTSGEHDAEYDESVDALEEEDA